MQLVCSMSATFNHEILALHICLIRSLRCAKYVIALLLAPLASANPLFQETRAFLDRAERETLYADAHVLRSRLAVLSVDEIERDASLVLNLFPDVELRAGKTQRRNLIVGDSSSGSFVYVELEQGGYASFYTSEEGIIKGSVSSRGGRFSIRSRTADSAEARQVIISEVISPEASPHESHMINGAFETVSPANTLNNQDAQVEPDALKVLALYTPAAERLQGGRAIMEASIRLEVEKMNQAFINSGIGHRRIEAEIERVEYEEASGDLRKDLRVLRFDAGHEGDPDGELDEAHQLREQHAADLVHLFLAGDWQFCGRAHWIGLATKRWAEESCGSDAGGEACRERLITRKWRETGFGVTVAADTCLSGDSFQHEVGHNLGLRHDRYTEKDTLSLEDPVNFPYTPYGFGYVNQDFSRPKCRRTIMAYRNQCENEGFTEYRSRVSELKFSNPEIHFDNDTDPSGVEGDELTTALDGPASAAKAIDDAWHIVSGLYIQDCPYASVFPNLPSSVAFSSRADTEVITFSPSGEMPETCRITELDLSVSSAQAFVSHASITKAETDTGGEHTLRISVARNDSCSERSHVLEVRETFTGALVRQIDVTQSGLAFCALISTVTVAPRQVTSLDFSNQGVHRIVPALFDEFSSLTYLNLSHNSIRSLSAHSFANNESLSALDDSLSKKAQIDLVEQDLAFVRGLVNLGILDLSHNLIESLHPAAFSGLANVRELDLSANAITALPRDVFAPLAAIELLWLDNNALTSIHSETFQGLPQLRALSLDKNRLTSFALGTLDNLTQLQYLWLSLDAMTTIPSGLFRHLASLRYLNLSVDGATTLPAGMFTGLDNLRFLQVSAKSLTRLPSEVCRFVRGVRYVAVSGSDIDALCGASAQPTLRRAARAFQDFSQLFVSPQWHAERLRSGLSMQLAASFAF